MNPRVSKHWSIAFFIFVFITYLTAVLIFPISGKSVGSKVLILEDANLRGTYIDSLLRGEGFDVTRTSIVPTDISLLEPYDVIIVHYSEISPAVLTTLANNGTGLLLIPERPDNSLLGLAGVISEWVPYKEDKTSKFLEHPVMEGVKTLSFHGYALQLSSSEVIPLVIGTDVEWGTKDPILVVANTIGSGRIIAMAYRAPSYPYTYTFDYYLEREDNALFLKNIVYWLADEDVPLFTHEIPSLIEIENNLDSLNNSIEHLNQRLDEINLNIGNIENIDEIIAQIDNLTEQLQVLFEQVNEISEKSVELDRISGELTDLTEQISVLSEQISENTDDISILNEKSAFPQWVTYGLVITSILSIVVLVISLQRK